MAASGVTFSWFVKLSFINRHTVSVRRGPLVKTIDRSHGLAMTMRELLLK